MKLTESDIKHVAKLAKLDVENDIKKYEEEINKIMVSIDQIISADALEDDILITPVNHNNRFFNQDETGNLEKDDIFKNAINNDEEYIVVSKVIE